MGVDRLLSSVLIYAVLKFLRKNTKTVIWGVVIAFVLWGGFAVSTSFQTEGRVAGKVFGKEITFQEFNRFYRAAQIFSFTEKPPEDPDFIKRLAWENIILSQEAKREKVKVSDDEIRAEVLRLLQSQKVPLESYERWLKTSVGESPQDFEAELREILRIRKLLNQVSTETDPAKRKEFFLAWSQTVMERANLEDYIPSSSPS